MQASPICDAQNCTHSIFKCPGGGSVLQWSCWLLESSLLILLVYCRHFGLFICVFSHCCLFDLSWQPFFSFPLHPHKFPLKITQHLFHVYLKQNQKTKCGYIIAQWYIITRDKNKGYNTSHQCPKILGLEGSQKTIYSRLYLSFMQRKNKMCMCAFFFRVYTHTQKSPVSKVNNGPSHQMRCGGPNLLSRSTPKFYVKLGYIVNFKPAWATETPSENKTKKGGGGGECGGGEGRRDRGREEGRDRGRKRRTEREGGKERGRKGRRKGWTESGMDAGWPNQPNSSLSHFNSVIHSLQVN